jgi:hypothetical protein
MTSPGPRDEPRRVQEASSAPVAPPSSRPLPRPPPSAPCPPPLVSRVAAAAPVRAAAALPVGCPGHSLPENGRSDEVLASYQTQHRITTTAARRLAGQGLRRPPERRLVKPVGVQFNET